MNKTIYGVAVSAALTLGLLLTPAPARAQAPPDAIDLSQATVYNSPTDIASWPATTAITQVTMAGGNVGLSFEFTKKSSWPDYTPPGWTGPIEYTVWAVVNVNGHWYTAGFIQMWRDRASTGAPLLTIPPGSSVNNFAKNWAYDARWGAMSYSVSGYQPHAGETVGFFVSAGNARGAGTVSSLRERSNVVAISLPANDTGVFTFAAQTSTSAMLLGDFNNDHVPDIMAQSSAGQVNLATGSGTTFSEPQSPYNGITSDWRIVGVGDFNRDGRSDLVWQNATGSVIVWLNNGSGAPGGVYLYAGASAFRVVAVADVNRDGNSDLIWQSPTGQVVVWFMQGTNLSGSSIVYGGISTWRVVGAADFNGDGDADLLWQGPDGTVVAWMLHGATQASTYVISGGGSVWRIVSVGDIDGDGKPDILWGNPTGQIIAWTMNGFTVTGTQYVNRLTAGWQMSITP